MYQAPVKDLLFALEVNGDLAAVAQLPGCEDAGLETAVAVLEESARFNQEVVAPLSRAGDLNPSSYANGSVKTTPGFKEAFKQFVEGGWQGLQHPAEFGGQGLPKSIATACIEMQNSADLSFALCPLLTDGAIEALLTAGSDEQKARYVPRLIDGSWTGTMNLTEPQAGSDLAQVRTKAVPQPDGSYRIFGQKIFITFGEHDMSDNIVHLVLARTPDAPEGVKGISLFIVNKYLVNPDGSNGARNDVYCASIEHKLGIKASPTAVLIYGDGKGDVGAGAIGYLVGQENRGLEYMFIMMNAARFAVGVQGIAVAERAYQKAVAYARDRVQSRAIEGSAAPVSIIHHPDVRRMLMTMRALTEGARALAIYAGAQYDFAHAGTEPAQRAKAKAAYEFLVPVVKGWSTEMSIDVASLGVQVHGGMGFIEETGAAQFYRDARILTIYEGTTAIQANDFVGRKTAKDAGETAANMVKAVHQTISELRSSNDPNLWAIADRLSAGADALAVSAQYVVDHFKGGISAVFAGSVPYLKLAGVVLCGWQLAKAALEAHRREIAGQVDQYLSSKQAVARFFADHILVTASALREIVTAGAGGTLSLAVDQF